MRVGGDSRGLVGISLPFSIPYLCFPCWLLVVYPLYTFWWLAGSIVLASIIFYLLPIKKRK